MNAIIGDNGIITRAQEANIKSGMSALQEYLQLKYTENYEDAEKYATKIDLLIAKEPNLFFKNGVRNYFVYDGKVYYLINKANLPDEIKNGLKGGDTTDTIALKNLYDVYGVNLDLTVYYINNKNDTVYGNLNPSGIDTKAKAQQIISGDKGVKETVEEKLKELNIEIDSELGITVGDISSINELTLDGSVKTIENISSIGELTSLKKLTLKNLKIENLNGLDNCLLLEYLYMDNCEIRDLANGFMPLCSLTKLNTFYMELPSEMKESTANDQVKGLSNGLSKATLLEKLHTFGVIGDETIKVIIDSGCSNHVDYTIQHDNVWQDRCLGINLSGNLTDITPLENLAQNIKNNVLTMYLYSNNLKTINVLNGFNKISELWVSNNKQLTSLSGLENHENIVNLFAFNCGITDLAGIENCKKLDYLLIENNSSLESLNGLDNVNFSYIYARQCESLSDISALGKLNENKSIHSKLARVDFTDCSLLQDVSPLKEDTSIRYLFLKGCLANDTNKNYWIAIDNIVELCGAKCLLPDICSNWLSNSNVRNFAVASGGVSLNDNSVEMESLRGKTKVIRLTLAGNDKLSDSYLNEILSTMTGMQYLQLKDCSNLETCSFVQYMPDLKELDIRGTKLIDLSLLNTEVKEKRIQKLQTLIIGNINTKMELIQDVINFLWSSLQFADSYSWVDPWYANCRALCLVGDGYDFSKCSSITDFCSNCSFDSGELDLSGCINLKNFRCANSARKYIFGAVSLEYYGVRGRRMMDDFSKISSIGRVSTDEMHNNVLGDSLSSLNKTASVSNLTLTRWRDDNLEFIYRIPDEARKKITRFEINSGGLENMLGIGDITSLNLLTNLDNCILRKLNLSDLSSLSTLRKLTSLTITDSTVADWSALPCSNDLEDNDLSISVINTNLNSLNFLTVDNNKIISLTLNNNKISRINEVQYLKKIKILNLTQNTIADLSGLNSLIVSNSTTLRTLTLDSNPIGDGCVYEESNIDVLKKLKSAGVTSFSFKNCGLGDLSL